MYVDAAGISVKVGAHYPGRPHGMPFVLPTLRGAGMCREESAEAIVARTTTGEGPNLVLRIGSFAVRVTEAIEGRAGMCDAAAEGTGRNSGKGHRSMSRHPLAGGSSIPEQGQRVVYVVEGSSMFGFHFTANATAQA